MKNSYKLPFFKIFFMGISFLLAFLDMTMLRDSIKLILTSIGSGMSSLIAFMIATMANLLAFEWGKSKAESEPKKPINKSALVGKWGWIFFGIIYIILKISEGLNQGLFETDIDINNLTQFVGSFCILAGSFITSGLIIASGAEDIFNREAQACRSSESEFNETRHELASEDAKINKKLSILENYESNFTSTRTQYLRHKKAITGAERAVCNEILGKTLQECEDIDPADAQKIVEDILKKREAEEEKIFNK